MKTMNRMRMQECFSFSNSSIFKPQRQQYLGN